MILRRPWRMTFCVVKKFSNRKEGALHLDGAWVEVTEFIVLVFEVIVRV